MNEWKFQVFDVFPNAFQLCQKKVVMVASRVLSSSPPIRIQCCIAIEPRRVFIVTARSLFRSLQVDEQLNMKEFIKYH